MPEPISQLAEQIASTSEETLSASLRMGTITEVETSGSFRVRTSATATAWLSRDRDTVLAVGDKVWMIRQGSVWLVGGRLSGGQATPVGTVNSYAGSTAPDGWLLCNGQAVDRTTYAALFAVIGTTYGSGNGSTTFNVPNLTNRVTVASGGTYARGATGGAASVTLTEAQMPGHDHGSAGSHSHPSAGSHSHTAPAYTTDDRTKSTNLFNTLLPAQSGTVNTSTSGDHTHGSAGGHTHTWEGGGQAHENMPPYLALPMIIRAQ